MIKIFGAPFDPLDISERVDVKLAYIDCLKRGELPEDDFLDPYDFLQRSVSKRRYESDNIQWIGSFPVDTWLRPKPSASDECKVSPERYTDFLDSNGCYRCASSLKAYLRLNMDDSIPMMVGVDHCLTGAALMYLGEKYGDFNVLVFDSHCDLVDLETQIGYFGHYRGASGSTSFGNEIYQCGSFLHYLLKSGVVKPKNLWILGTQDVSYLKTNAQSLYSLKILPWIDQGMHIVSKDDLLRFGLPDDITGRTYISFDMDLGSMSSVLAARFLNFVGFSVEQISDLIEKLSRKVSRKEIDLVGLDIMEVDVHSLGADLGYCRDYTEDIMCEIFEKLIYLTFAGNGFS